LDWFVHAADQKLLPTLKNILTNILPLKRRLTEAFSQVALTAAVRTSGFEQGYSDT
jgi:hypothetical protein